jgi:CheY-like chemotaxis protein
VPIRVVLVDDVEDVRRLLRTALRFRGGFEVVGEAAEGAEGVRLATTLHPDVVVLDLGLPDIAGREVLRRIRETSPESKVVVFSGTDTADRAWIAEHVAGYVLKDTDIDYLVDLLESVGRPSDGQAVCDLPQELTSVGLARRFVRAILVDWGLPDLIDDALVVVSELTANAITHAYCSCELRLSLTPSALRVEVVDSGAGAPEPQPASSTREHGRGLHLVAALSTAWGMESVGPGKLVWAELPRLRAADRVRS